MGSNSPRRLTKTKGARTTLQLILGKIKGLPRPQALRVAAKYLADPKGQGGQPWCVYNAAQGRFAQRPLTAADRTNARIVHSFHKFRAEIDAVYAAMPDLQGVDVTSDVAPASAAAVAAPKPSTPAIAMPTSAKKLSKASTSTSAMPTSAKKLPKLSTSTSAKKLSKASTSTSAKKLSKASTPTTSTPASAKKPRQTSTPTTSTPKSPAQARTKRALDNLTQMSPGTYYTGFSGARKRAATNRLRPEGTPLAVGEEVVAPFYEGGEYRGRFPARVDAIDWQQKVAVVRYLDGTGDHDEAMPLRQIRRASGADASTRALR